MSGGRDDDTPFQAEANASAGVDPAGAAAQGIPLVGWYYFGPEPPWANPAANAWQGAPYGPGHGRAGCAGGRNPTGGGAGHHASDDSADLMEAFDRLSRGDLSADTIGKLFNLKERDFWTGALVGAAGALLATNLPTLINMVSGMARAKTGADKSDGTTKAKSDSNTNEERK
jgi:hypothetical protein